MALPSHRPWRTHHALPVPSSLPDCTLRSSCPPVLCTSPSQPSLHTQHLLPRPTPPPGSLPWLQANALHDAILRKWMPRWHGYEVTTEGDSFLIAFHEASDALGWCLTVQQALMTADWPPDMGHHGHRKSHQSVASQQPPGKAPLMVVLSQHRPGAALVGTSHHSDPCFATKPPEPLPASSHGVASTSPAPRCPPRAPLLVIL